MSSPERASSLLDGLRLSVTTLTVLPVRAGTVDRRAAAIAMSTAPLVGAALGAAIAGLGWCAGQLGVPNLVTAALLVLALALFTRGLHLDGLADTVDGLASYRDREGALRIMSSPEVGPLGAAALLVVLLVEFSSLTTLLQRQSWLAISIGIALGRIAITQCCWRRMSAARSDGLGAMVAGSVPTVIIACWTLLAVAAVALPHHHHWPVAVAPTLTAVVVAIGLAHVRRRLGGITGDVLGAACEIATALGLAVLTIT